MTKLGVAMQACHFSYLIDTESAESQPWDMLQDPEDQADSLVGKQGFSSGGPELESQYPCQVVYNHLNSSSRGDPASLAPALIYTSSHTDSHTYTQFKTTELNRTRNRRR